MKLKLPLIAAFVAVLGLTACGGGGGGSTAGTTVESPLALSKSDIVIGTGATAALGNQITVNYTLWLYSSTAAGFKGTQIESGSGAVLVLASGPGGVIEGWVQGIPGMKVGGKRTLVVPGSLGYGASGSGTKVPPNAGLVFDVELTAVK